MRDLALTVTGLVRKQRDTYDFKNVGISKQAAFLHELGDWVEDSLKTRLDAELGKLPSELQKVIMAGEERLKERLHLLKMADKWCWSAVTEFTTMDLEEEDKVTCINPISVASNRVGKRRLCIDLSRHVNNSCMAKKFKIESIDGKVRLFRFKAMPFG